jgi:hypothetical protein
MAWTNKQKQLAVRACREADISEEQRTDMILRNFKHAEYGGDITSTSPRLTNQDFAEFMVIVENFAGGKVLHFTAGYWKQQSIDSLSRMKFKAHRLEAALVAAEKLQPHGIGLSGWIEKRVSGGATRNIDELEYHGMLALILGLEAYARQNAVRIDVTPAVEMPVGV